MPWDPRNQFKYKLASKVSGSDPPLLPPFPYYWLSLPSSKIHELGMDRLDLVTLDV